MVPMVGIEPTRDTAYETAALPTELHRHKKIGNLTPALFPVSHPAGKASRASLRALLAAILGIEPSTSSFKGSTATLGDRIKLARRMGFEPMITSLRGWRPSR